MEVKVKQRKKTVEIMLTDQQTMKMIRVMISMDTSRTTMNTAIEAN